MGNSTSRPTNKLNMLVEETKDFSFNLTQNISQAAEQTIVSAQSQQVTLQIEKLEGCKIDITQSANIMAKQEAMFKAVFTNPRELIRKICVGPDSILEQAFSSQSKVMRQFLDSAKKQMGANSDQNLKLKMTNILKINIDQNSIQRCSQNIFTSQDQKVSILGKLCKDSKIRIAQDLIISAAQDCFFEVTQNALMEDPSMRRAVREFNGDYSQGYMDDQLDAGAKIPDACFNTGKITVKNPNSPSLPGLASSAGITDVNDCEAIEKEMKKLRTMNTILLALVIILIFSMFFIFYKSKQK
jgi:hypothetical protein